MADLELLPDPGAVFRTWAIAQPDLVALVGTRVSITLSGSQPALRYAVVSDTAGSYGEGQPLIQVDCWGAGAGAVDDGTASLLARTLAAAVTGAGGLPAAVEGGPYQSDDPTTHRPRWIVPIRLLTFAA